MSDIGSYDFKKTEESMIEFWEKNSIYPKCKAKGEGKQKFFFIQGPPYTSGRIHIGHAWNNSLKDIALRYKRMKGFDVFDRAAYDMHGLPTAHKVMAELDLHTKEDILSFGMEKFIKACMDFCVDKAKLMDKDLWRLGVWMDFENARYPVDNSYIEGVWFLIKKAHERERLYEGLRTMSWCASCQTAMAKHECEYKEVTDDSIFVKFPVKGKENEFIIIWTTTPWTITFNLAVMVHPELEYVRAKVGDETWILAKGMAAPVVQTVANKNLEIVEEFPGSDLEGLEYTHPWDDRLNHYKEIKANHEKAHTIILSEEFVNLGAGTGLVHCAPGCGPEDYEVGHKNNIPPFNTLMENGVFPDDMGPFSGWTAKVDDKKFIDVLKEDGNLVETTPVEHDYAHCERCRNPVIFRTTKQWFFKVEDLKERMVEANEKVGWIPEAGKNGFRSWLENLRDNSITKQRFWGTPAPIWKCPGCEKVEVIGSAQELKDRAGHCPDNLHKPWIDSVELSCDCGGMMKRLPDVLDVWIDAGTLSWNILDYPSNQDGFNKLWPADFILEAKEQIRGWFNMLMVTSIIAFDDPLPFKNCYMHGMLTDVGGQKMSKSLGNVISPYEIVDKHGADTLRYYMCETNAGEDIKFSWEEAALRHRNLGVLWNIHKYLIDFYRNNELDLVPFDQVKESLGEEERYLLSKTASTVKRLTCIYDEYRLDEINPVVQDLFLEISRTYIQLTREKSVSGSPEEKQAMFYTMYHSLLNCIKVFAPSCPFITEHIYQNLKEEFGLESESVHMHDWPDFDESMINNDLEEKFEITKSIIQAILAAREKAQLGVRWPVADVIINTKDEKVVASVESLGDIIKRQTNVKSLSITAQFDKIKSSVKADFSKMGPAFGAASAKVIAQLSMTSAESLLAKIENDGKYVLNIDNEEFEIKKEHIIIKRDVPEQYIETVFRNGLVYLDKSRTDALDAEGFARETMRHVQSLRKKSGLVKSDDISLFIQVDEGLKSIITQWTDPIKEKVGAKVLTLSDNLPAKPHEFKEKFKIKGKEISIEFDMIKEE